MELDLRLGTPAAEESTKTLAGEGDGRPSTGLKLGLCRVEVEEDGMQIRREREMEERMDSVDPPAQLNVFLPDHHLMCLKNASFPARESPSPSSKFSDDEENNCARKKLRLSKEQSAFLEDNFKEHSTLKPKQKTALAKHLNLRPRQVEVWFQNRRARTKLKKTEVDCENLKHCCQALTEENRRLQKELSDLKALKATHPFYAQFPATTLSLCAACGRKSKSAVAGGGGASKASAKQGPFTSLFAKVRFHALTRLTMAPAHRPSAAS